MSRKKTDWDERKRLVAFQRLGGGRLYRAVVVSGIEGGWPPGAPQYQVDGVFFADHPEPGFVEWTDHPDEFTVDVTSRDALLVSAWGYADRPVLGRLLAGRELLARSYPDHRLLRCVALSGAGEENMDWVFRRHGIELIAVNDG